MKAKMSPEEQRVAIAEACGFKPTPKLTINGMPIYERAGKLFASKVAPADNADWLPNYLTSLDAMHEAEKLLLNNGKLGRLYGQFKTTLRHITNQPFHDECHATAGQRAEAFLRTLGKWKEEV